MAPKIYRDLSTLEGIKQETEIVTYLATLKCKKLDVILLITF